VTFGDGPAGKGEGEQKKKSEEGEQSSKKEVGRFRSVYRQHIFFSRTGKKQSWITGRGKIRNKGDRRKRGESSAEKI